MNKAALGTIVGTALLGLAKYRGSGNKSFPISDTLQSKISDFIDDSLVISDVCFPEAGSKVFVIFNTYKPIEDIEHAYAINVWCEDDAPKNITSIEDICEYLGEKTGIDDEVEGIDWIVMPPNGRPPVPVYYSVKENAWIKSKRHFAEQMTGFQQAISQQQSEEQEPEKIFDLIPVSKRISWKPFKDLPDLFLSHATTEQSLEPIAKSGYLDFPSLALSWMVPPNFGDVFFIFDPYAIPRVSFGYNPNKKLFLFESDAYTLTGGSSGNDSDFKRERLEGGTERPLWQAIEFTEKLEERDIFDGYLLRGQVGGAAYDDIRVITNIKELEENYRILTKYHFENRQMVFRTRKEQEDFISSLTNNVDRAEDRYYRGIYPYMEAKFNGKLSLRSIQAIVVPSSKYQKAKDFIEMAGINAEILTYTLPKDVMQGQLAIVGEDFRINTARAVTEKLYRLANRRE